MAQALYNFLEKNFDLRDHASFIKKAIYDLESESWAKGYKESVVHSRRRETLRSKKLNPILKGLIDFISDLTHQKRVSK